MTEDKYITEVERLRPRMVATATRYLENSDEAEDITQDALLKLWSMHQMLQESDVDRLAFTIIKHLCINELKRREYRKGDQSVSIDSIDVAMDSHNPQEIEEREQQLMTAVNKLPSRQRLLLQMRYLKGKDVSTIAAITGGTEQGIHKALKRARVKVYQLMAAVVVAVICMGVFTFRWQQPADTPLIANKPTQAETPRTVMPTDSTETPVHPLPTQPQLIAETKKPQPETHDSEPTIQVATEIDNPSPPPVEDTPPPPPPEAPTVDNEMLYLAILEQKVLEEELIQQAIYQELFTELAQQSNTPELSI